ncbi:poly-gamma-glutamate synthase PgsB/CapB [Neorhodopirellula lusitana]|uniref:Poly-gamma-glutamate synthase PgsB/CapB n=1 Tax=Neorhodopirellula lusitana TaxID=445327 RepID=A0ABY1Q621_9BACT|nr:poly-gamma-glutamate synthase PgsB [Neorhodopirellula lusitana]SMP56627.1 poly-gamma-glutamate synthase PgsB/CapB [Neorhodopirellula lusitana]
MNGLHALVAVAATVGLAALVEAWWYRRQLEKIPYRIHVNGTRGKSSVTRLIAAGLRAGGIKTCAKTTGTLARMIFTDGRELPIFRPDRANVIEQKRIVKTAVAEKAEALVIECMALQPLLQSVCELKLVRSTHGVITNARADHLDVMGPTRLDVARALSATVPVGGKFLTAEDRDDSLGVMNEACRDRGSEMRNITSADSATVTAEELSQFSYLEHAENVALSLAVCAEMGVDRDVALQGMWAAEPDPGAMRVHQQTVTGDNWHFVNAFAANDPESTTRIWDAAHDYFPGVTRRVLVMNCRVDRIDRSVTMANACVDWRSVDRVVIIGSGTDVFLRRLLKGGMNPDHILCLGNASGREVVSTLTESFAAEEAKLQLVGAGTANSVNAGLTDGSTESEANSVESTDMMIMGVGNIAGPGMALADFFADENSCTDFAVKKVVSKAGTNGESQPTASQDTRVLEMV